MVLREGWFWKSLIIWYLGSEHCSLGAPYKGHALGGCFGVRVGHHVLPLPWFTSASVCQELAPSTSGAPLRILIQLTWSGSLTLATEPCPVLFPNGQWDLWPHQPAHPFVPAHTSHTWESCIGKAYFLSMGQSSCLGMASCP